jgi:hypothetical protein
MDRWVSSTPPVFLRMTKAFVTSPMPWVTSMLVLQPRTSTATDGPPGGLAAGGVRAGVSDGISVGADVAVMNWRGVDVAIAAAGVALAAITTGVAVRIEGVLVGGRKGVGGLKGPGWITQPLQDARKSTGNIRRIVETIVLMVSPPDDCIPLF